MAVTGVSGNSLFYRVVVSQSYPTKLVKFASVPLELQQLPRKPLCCSCDDSSSSFSSFTALSTETPPDGYRRNVGICLINSSKKVSVISLSEYTLHLFYISELLLIGKILFIHYFFFFVENLCSYENTYTIYMANASGRFDSIPFWVF